MTEDAFTTLAVIGCFYTGVIVWIGAAIYGAYWLVCWIVNCGTRKPIFATGGVVKNTTFIFGEKCSDSVLSPEFEERIRKQVREGLARCGDRPIRYPVYVAKRDGR